jgi:fibronectin type 3 domain-containing protein
MKKTSIILWLMLMVAMADASSAGANEEPGALLSASGGNGDIYLLWIVPFEKLPEKGWQLSTDKGKVLVPQILPVSQTDGRGFTREQIDSVRGFMDSRDEAKDAGREARGLFNGFFILNVLSSFEKARAFGLAWKLERVPPGPVRYVVTGLDKAKRPKGIRLISDRIDGSRATPLPPAPEGLNIITDTEGAKLFWTPAPDSKAHPVLAYEVERAAKETTLSGTFRTTLGSDWEPEHPAFIDAGVPVENEVTYRVYSVDCFGRKSRPASHTLFVPDTVTLLAPQNLSAKPGSSKITLSWETKDDARPAGFVVERAAGSGKLFQTLTPEGLSPKTRQFTDKDVIQGIYYQYRIRAVGTDGTLGEPSLPVTERVPSGKIKAPGNVTADVSPILVTLSWENSDDPVKGYIVERRSKDSDIWARQNDRLVLPRQYKDPLKAGTYGTFYYRVTAVGFDGSLSKPGKDVKVTLEDLTPPARPVITAIEGKDGTVRLTFDPAKNDTKTKTFTVLRDHPSRKQGNIIAANIPVKKRRFEDTGVVPGDGYWYAVVAVDADGKESPVSEKHLVTVMPPPVPKPPKPSLKAVSEPFAHVKISFRQPPDTMAVSLQRKDREDTPWTTLLNGLTGTDKAVDAHPVDTGTAWYRIVYHIPGGPEGEPSDAVEIKR